jgi:DNA polymerase-3 subunit gamma/tau
MDAASKTGVDDVRDLIEFSRYGPTSAKYKIFIIDEVHMLSKQAFNALLKTLEEPPEYLKFIFATTEIKKIPITVVSRCQRFDLSRIKSFELFNFLKKIIEMEMGKVSDEALKFIVRISEGSVRDALSLLDRALLSQEQGAKLDLDKTQKIFGYFDKSYLIELFQNIFEGNEKETLKIYRSIYDQGIAPNIFLNDFLELLYYFKNISSLKYESASFSLNDKEFDTIKKMSESVDSETLLLFWQFTIKTLEEIDIVSNQNLSMEMFLIRLIYLKGMSNISEINSENKNATENIKGKVDQQNLSNDQDLENDLLDIKNKTIGQIKNVTQEKKEIEQSTFKIKNKTNLQIKTFDDLIEICNLKKEIKLKYELETNVNLVSFDDCRIEISFNNNLDKEFIKNLSTKLYEWTDERWIISLSQKIGQPSQKEKNDISKKKFFKEIKKEKLYKKILELFPDAELIDIKSKNEN